MVTTDMVNRPFWLPAAGHPGVRSRRGTIAPGLHAGRSCLLPAYRQRRQYTTAPSRGLR